VSDTLWLYWRYTAISLRGQMQYRASFLMMAFGNLFATAVEFAGIVALFARFGSLRGWRLPEIALFYGMVGIAFAVAETVGRGFDLFPNVIKAGDFDRLLLRPRGTAFQVAAQEMQLMRLGRFSQALAVLLWAMWHRAGVWTAPQITLLLLSIAGGTCLFYGLFVLQATLAFWTVESLEIMNTVTYGGTETAQYPLSIYNPWFRRFFTFVIPLACINYLPSRVLLPDAPVESGPIWAAWLAPFVGVAFLLIAFRIWNIGVRHYRSTGS
jgi:ABC-2 type transport system permease protein